MNKKDVYFNVAKQLGFSRNRLGEIKLSDGKILISHFADVFTRIKLAIIANKKNGDVVDEFSNKSKHPWDYLNPNAKLLQFCHLLGRHSNRATARIRAECMNPIISKEQLILFLATQLEVEPSAVDLNKKVREIKLPVAGYDKNSWVTFVIWADQLYGDQTLQDDLDAVSDITIEELFQFWMKK